MSANPDGSLPMTDVQSLAFPVIMQPYDDGGTYHYYCTARPGSALDAYAWRVTRVTDATGVVRLAGDGGFSYRATSLAVVAALSYLP